MRATQRELVDNLGDELSVPFPDLSILEARILYTFRQRGLLERALTHPSYANERRGRRHHNQRMEFLGDSVLGMIVAAQLYRREELDDEGTLTRNLSGLVCERALANKARELDLGSFLRLGKGEDGQGGRKRDSILCDAYEALVASVFLDGGYEAARDMVVALHDADFEANRRPRAKAPNYKGQLQGVIQSRYNVQPIYQIIREYGLEHHKMFVARVLVLGEVVGEGEGQSKKQAEQRAAEQAMRQLDITPR